MNLGGRVMFLGTPQMKPKPYEGDIEVLAAKYRQDFKRLQRGKQVDVRAFLKEGLRCLGGRIVIAQDTWCHEDFVVHDGAFDVVVSPVSSLHRDNFTIAHSIGHWAMHYREGITKLFRGDSIIEAQADRFALGLLIPKNELMAYVDEAKGDIYRIAGHFGVTPSIVADALGALPKPMKPCDLCRKEKIELIEKSLTGTDGKFKNYVCCTDCEAKLNSAIEQLIARFSGV